MKFSNVNGEKPPLIPTPIKATVDKINTIDNIFLKVFTLRNRKKKCKKKKIKHFFKHISNTTI
jgi:hypothetical protein